MDWITFFFQHAWRFRGHLAFLVLFTLALSNLRARSLVRQLNAGLETMDDSGHSGGQDKPKLYVYNFQPQCSKRDVQRLKFFKTISH